MDAAQAVGLTLSGAALVGGAVLYVIQAEIRKDRTEMEEKVAGLLGRINTHEAGCTERQRRLDERRSVIQERLTAIDHRSEGMDAKLDRLLERL